VEKGGAIPLLNITGRRENYKSAGEGAETKQKGGKHQIKRGENP